MLLIRGLIASVVVMMFVAAPEPVRAADVWGCNYYKCVAYCTKVSGKTRTTFCERRLQDKRRDKICK